MINTKYIPIDITNIVDHYPLLLDGTFITVSKPHSL